MMICNMNIDMSYITHMKKIKQKKKKKNLARILKTFKDYRC